MVAVTGFFQAHVISVTQRITCCTWCRRGVDVVSSSFSPDSISRNQRSREITLIFFSQLIVFNLSQHGEAQEKARAGKVSFGRLCPRKKHIMEVLVFFRNYAKIMLLSENYALCYRNYATGILRKININSSLTISILT